MNIPLNCPEISILNQFLDGKEVMDPSGTWTRDFVEQHVNDCEICQQSMQRLVAGQESWEGAARELAEIDAARRDSPAEAPTLRKMIDQEKDRHPGIATGGLGTASSVEQEAMSLDFLSPTDQPDSRGRLGTYEVLDVVGRGGMGVVLKAYDPSLRRIVAIKVMAPHLASSPVARKRFVREARAAAAVSHDHVVAIFSVEENQEPPFLVMQFVSGKTLQERVVASGPLSVPEILRIGMQTASGLAAAHAQGLVHRDIKPANILLENGVERVKITDFGLARAVDDVGMTQTGVVAGTPQFMAPEQANGEAIDVRSDLFSLGSVLYTICTGRPPFRATTTMGLLRRICDETPRPIRELNPEIPEWLETIISKLLMKNPVDRYQTAKEVAELLGNWLAHVQRPTAVPAPDLVAVSTGVTTQKQELNGTKRTNGTDETARGTPEFQTGRGSGPTIALPASFFSTLWGDYTKSVVFSGDVDKSFDLAVSSLTGAGFVLDQRTPTSLKMTGPGLNRLRGNVLAAASTIEVSCGENRLSVNAQMGTLRKLHCFLLAILAIFLTIVGSYTFLRISAPPVEGLIALFVLGPFIGSSIFFSRREIRRAFDIFLGNLAKTGAVNSIADLKSSNVPRSTIATCFHRLGEAYPTRVYWITAAIWGAFMVPFLDSMGTIPFPVIHWLAVAVVVMGFLWPAGVIGFAWRQRRRSGTWDKTILRHSPGQLLAIPTIYVFLLAAGYWGWQQLTCGTVSFDVDDPNFTISLTNSELKGPGHRHTQSYSADFYRLRLRPGNYHWGVRHGQDWINQGQFKLSPRTNHLIYARSPFPVGEADAIRLQGRWKFSGDGPSNEFNYFDVIENELRFDSPGLIEKYPTVFSFPLLANVAGSMVYSIRITASPTGGRGPTWIDLSVIDEKSNSPVVVSHGIFNADSKTLTMRLTGSHFSRPTHWGIINDDNSRLFMFERADDLTLLQGFWEIQNPHDFPNPEFIDHPRPTRFLIRGDKWLIASPAALKQDSLLGEATNVPLSTMKIDSSQTPKRITLTDPPKGGQITMTEGIYQIDGDRLTLALGTNGFIPKDFDSANKDISAILLFKRSKP